VALAHGIAGRRARRENVRVAVVQPAAGSGVDDHRGDFPTAVRVDQDHAASLGRDAAAAVTAFASDATVTDDGKTYQGTAAIERWLNRSAGEFTYTVELTGAQQTGPNHYIATHHLEGDFPGGTVDPRHRFTLRDSLVTRLVIEP
jgi:hypothetical protein